MIRSSKTGLIDGELLKPYTLTYYGDINKGLE